MKIRSIDELQNSLDSDMALRKRELSSIYQLIQLSRDHQKKALTRVGIGILYSHWEGFIKYAATCYLCLINHQGIKHENLQYNILAISMKSKINELHSTNSQGILIDFVKFFTENKAEKAIIPYDTSVDTGSNLNSKILENISLTVGIDFSFYVQKEKLIDVNLLKVRNEIAHGEHTPVSEKEFNDIYFEVIDMMEYFKNQIENSASQKSYIRKKLT